ncbi:MAG: L-rhamnose mutarotase [Bacteroidales bacterium]|nr:L-rhamnose mutarotase [Bacteroidales bacterium]
MRRIGMAIRIKPECLEEYIKLHINPASELIVALEKSNIRNNTVFHTEDILFNYFEYYGTDFESDWMKYTESTTVKELFGKMKGFFLPVGEIFPKTGWSVMNEVFRKD